MKVFIKKGTELIPATIEMVDGNMIVSPQVDEFVPKDGDVVAINAGTQIFVCKKYLRDGVIHAYFGWDFTNNVIFDEGEWYVDRHATEEEKQKLFYKLKEKGLAWDAEKRKLVKLKWKPVLGEVYFRVEFVDDEFRYADWNWKNSTYEVKAYERGWCFKNEEECKSFCDKLNQSINSVKP